MVDKVSLLVSRGDKVVLWSSGDYERLRSHCRIPALLVGTLPFAAQQNVFLGLPALLTREEVYILVKEDLVELVDADEGYDEPTREQVEAHESAERDGGDEGMSSKGPMVKIQGDSKGLPWYRPQQDPSLAQRLVRPRDDFEAARFAIAHDLWRRGYFLGGGLRFGGHYLVYPGDPLRYHSHFVATVFADGGGDGDAAASTKSFTSMDIVAWGRLGTAVKKAHLVAGWDRERKEPDYFTVEWAGFG